MFLKNREIYTQFIYSNRNVNKAITLCCSLLHSAIAPLKLRLE
jgi:hypothetical protein